MKRSFAFVACLFAGMLLLAACGGTAQPAPTPSPILPTATQPPPHIAITPQRPEPTETPVAQAATPTRPIATAPTPTLPAETAESKALSDSIQTIEDWRAIVGEIAQGEATAARARAAQVWTALAAARRVPLVLGNQTVFLYWGETEESVVWRGVFTQWEGLPALEGRRTGPTSLWVAQTRIAPASRVEYKIVLNGDQWINDPANPNLVPSGKTINNFFVTPGFKVSDESAPRTDVEHGTLSPNIPIKSSNLGYTVNYRVYTPVGYETMSDLPTFYVLDGSDFISPTMGSFPSVLDNMIGTGRVRPVLAVFIDPYGPDDPTFNRREVEFLGHSVEFARFVATEVVPAIDATYRTAPGPDARTIMGVSYGGLSAVFIAATYSDVFHRLAAFSPAMWVLGAASQLANPDLRDGAGKMVAPIDAITQCGGETGKACPPLPLNLFATFGTPEWDVGDFNLVVYDVRSKGYPIKAIQVNEGHTWSAWRGLLDEMLLYIVPK